MEDLVNQQELEAVSATMWELKKKYPVSYIIALYLIELGIYPDEITEEEMAILVRAVENCEDDTLLSEEIMEILNSTK